MRDAVTQINIENPVARESFIRWWRTMEAQGYQYGFEALCNVWVGFDDGRADLARKVLDAVSGERLTENLDNEGDKGYSQALDDVIRALQNLFAREGVNSTAPIAAAPAAPSPGEPSDKAGDGRYCRHHDDDPSHGAICYDSTIYEG